MTQRRIFNELHVWLIRTTLLTVIRRPGLSATSSTPVVALTGLSFVNVLCILVTLNQRQSAIDHSPRHALRPSDKIGNCD